MHTKSDITIIYYSGFAGLKRNISCQKQPATVILLTDTEVRCHMAQSIIGEEVCQRLMQVSQFDKSDYDIIDRAALLAKLIIGVGYNPNKIMPTNITVIATLKEIPRCRVSLEQGGSKYITLTTLR